MRLRELFTAAGVEPIKIEGDADLSSMTIDSRQVRADSLFVCMPGTTNDSHGFIPDASAKGASAVLVWDEVGFEAARSSGLAVAQLPTDRLAFNEVIWRLCDVFFEHPTRNMKVVGVTGTNGKTTTAWLIRDMLRALGLKAGYLGTLGFQLPDEERELSNTTPFAVELYNLLAEARDKGVEALAMEVSSHALAERRADGIEFDAAVFTNLTQDHLDFHGSMAEYEAAKFRLFTDLPQQTSKSFVGAINVDDAVGQKWGAQLAVQSPMVLFGLTEEPGELPDSFNLAGCATEVRLDEIEMWFREDSGTVGSFRASLGGSYNVENLASAVAGLLALGFELEEICEAANSVRPVPGRFEAVPNERGIGVLVDYAHTPDALEKLLDAVRPLTKGRVITVFGCGGDRDRTKRPKMAKAASERSDVTVVTSDNPRTEDPQSILDEVLTGIVPGRDSVDIIDRREAITHAVKIAQPGDVVVIAGKGHENYQIIGRTKYPMDDREMAREALA